MVWIIDILQKIFNFVIGLKDWITTPINSKFFNSVMNLLGISEPLTPLGLIGTSFGVLVILMLVKKVVPLA